LGERRYLYRGKILSLAIEDGRWEIVEHKDAVAVLLEREGMVLFVEQYRPAVGATTLELPAGLIEPGENPAEAARRELMEEAGFDADLEELFSFYSSPGFTDEKITLFRARRPRPRRRPPDPGERITVRWIALEKALFDLRQGRLLTSGPTVAGLLWLAGEREP